MINLDGLEFFFKIGFIAIVLTIVFGVYIFVDKAFINHKTFKTKSKPTISWELKANEQKVDSVWVYKFK